MQELTAVGLGKIKTASRFDKIETTIVIKKLLADKKMFAALTVRNFFKIK
ncbi:MAG: hypothetical protein LBN01_04495 [Endomicrobium sp.]|nr:hypothetical protein [Endomicrobium sp.]